MTMAERIAVMRDGRFMQTGAPGELYETPSSRFVADFIGSVNLMEGTLDIDAADHCVIGCADVRHFVGHGITGTEGMAVTVALRPEKIAIGREPPPDTTHNAVRGTVQAKSYFGSSTVYHLALQSGAVLKASEANTERHRDAEITWGEAVWASWSPSAHVVLTQ